MCATGKTNAMSFATTNNMTVNQTDMMYMTTTMTPTNVSDPVTGMMPIANFLESDYIKATMGIDCSYKGLTTQMKYQGMWRDWLGACFAGSLCLFFGCLWLYKEMILLAFIINFTILPTWTAGMIYDRYNQPNGNVFTTWWYAAVCVWQFFVGFATMYLYCWLKEDLETRAREEEIKLVQHKMKFPRDC